jgi:putative hydrolase of the HAD superfamily
LPAAVLLDLDDTILDDSSRVDECWRAACASHAERLAPHQVGTVTDVIRRTAKWFWSDPDRHRNGRLELDTARREVARLALHELGITDARLAAGIGDGYSHRRDVEMAPLPGAIDTVRWLRESGLRLALLTNGAGPAQRRKISRFNLADLFDAICIEGEMGFGKPDARAFRLALDELGVRASDAWMIGDNLEWDVAASQDAGMLGVWIDTHGGGLPENTCTRPRYIVRSLSDVRSLIATW